MISQPVRPGRRILVGGDPIFACLLPVPGSVAVWLPAAAYLAVTGRWLGVGVVLGGGALTATLVDGLLYARLVGERLRMHSAVALVALLGGLAVFGISGVVLGPAILAVTEAILEVMKRRTTCEDDARAISGSRLGEQPARA